MKRMYVLCLLIVPLLISCKEMPSMPGGSSDAIISTLTSTLGLTEQIIFPEINYDRVEKVRGMDVTFVTTAKTDEEGRELLRLLQMPFRQPSGAREGAAAEAAVAAGV